MNKKYKKKFEEFVYTYASGYRDCMSKDTGEGYPIVFAKSHWARCLDYFEDRHHIEIKPTDEEAYRIYEEIMLSELNRFISEHKAVFNKKEKEYRKQHGVRRKKDK